MKRNLKILALLSAINVGSLSTAEVLPKPTPLAHPTLVKPVQLPTAVHTPVLPDHTAPITKIASPEPIVHTTPVAHPPIAHTAPVVHPPTVHTAPVVHPPMAHAAPMVHEPMHTPIIHHTPVVTPVHAAPEKLAEAEVAPAQKSNLPSSEALNKKAAKLSQIASEYSGAAADFSSAAKSLEQAEAALHKIKLHDKE